MSLRADLHAFVDRIADEIEKTQRADDWVSQKTSPLGRAKHLRLAREGVLPSVKEGRDVLVKRSDLDAYLAKHAKLAVVPAETEEQEAARLAATIGRGKRK